MRLMHRFELAIAAIFRNEAPYLREWIEFHRLVGVEHPVVQTGMGWVAGARLPVVMVDVNANSYPVVNWARHLLHIGVTRAAHVTSSAAAATRRWKPG